MSMNRDHHRTIPAGDRDDRYRGIEDLRAAVAARICPLVAHLPEQQVFELISHIVQLKLKYERGIRTTPGLDGRAVGLPDDHVS
jgi:hypothetical protein